MVTANTCVGIPLPIFPGIYGGGSASPNPCSPQVIRGGGKLSQVFLTLRSVTCSFVNHVRVCSFFCWTCVFSDDHISMAHEPRMARLVEEKLFEHFRGFL